MMGAALGLEHFALRRMPIPELRDGQALVRVKLVNIHAATRSRLAGGIVPVGETDRHNYACAEVLQSRDAAFAEGDIIACQDGWQDYQVIGSADPSVGYGPASVAVRALNRTNSQWTYVFRPQMTALWPPETLMDVFGTSGMTAWFGLRACGPLRPGEGVLVAGAGGSVGSIAAQLAKAAGCHVVGLAGGGDLTARVIRHMNREGRLLAYGAAAAMYSERPGAPSVRPRTPRELFVSPAAEALIAARKIKVEAWIVDDFYQDRIVAEDELSRLLLAGAVKPVHNTVAGFENLPQAIVSLYVGAQAGKLQVRIA
jgi:hypothetical protein